MERESTISHTRRESLPIVDFFTPLETIPPKRRSSSANLKESVLELQQSQQSQLALELRRRSSASIQHESTQNDSSREPINFFGKLLHRSILSQVAWVFRLMVSKSRNCKNGIEYLDCFTGTIAVVCIFLFKTRIQYVLLLDQMIELYPCW